MTQPVFGLSIERIESKATNVVFSDMSVVGIVGTAASADTSLFPADTPVVMSSSDATLLTALGTDGTLPDALSLINDQMGEFNSSAKVVIVRVEEGVDDDATITNILGDGIGTGMYALLDAPAELGVTPRLVIVPGYTWQRTGTDANAVCAALPALLSKLLAHAIVDAPTGNVTAVTDWRETIASERIIGVHPGVKIYENGATVVVPASPAIAGIAVRRDNEKAGVPSHSWANQQVYGITGPSQPLRFSLTDGSVDAQQLLTANMGVIFRSEFGADASLADGGFLFVGTDNLGTEPLWQFYNVTRMRDYINLMMIKTTRAYLGKFNLTKQTVQSIINVMNEGLATLKARGAILGYNVSFLPAANNVSDLRNGRLTVTFEAEEAPVLRQITIQSGRYEVAVEQLIADLAA